MDLIWQRANISVSLSRMIMRIRRCLRPFIILPAKNQLDVVKSGYYFYYSIPKERNEKLKLFLRVEQELHSVRQLILKLQWKWWNSSILNQQSGLQFIAKILSEIMIPDLMKHRELLSRMQVLTSKVMAQAKRVQLIQEAFLHYRQDNENSSVNSPGKVFCVCDEYKEMQRF